MQNINKEQLTWWGSIIAVLLVTVGGITFLASRNSGGTTIDATTTVESPREDEWQKGAAADTAKVSVIVYSDFQCPGCKNVYSLEERLLKEYPDLRIIYRHFPLESIHPNAFNAALASEAAGAQGKFWEMHDLLFKNQSEWKSKSRSGAKDIFKKYAENLQLDINAFQTYSESPEAKQRVNAGKNSAQSANLQGTPTIFINGKIHDYDGTYTSLKKDVDAAIASAT